MNLRRILAFLALLLIGEAIIALIRPRRYLSLWEVGPKPFQDFIENLRERRDLTRGLAIGELALGLWLALRGTNESE